MVTPGRVYAADYAVPTPSNLTTAVLDMQAAYSDAASRNRPDYLNLGSGNIGGKTLAPGLYTLVLKGSATYQPDPKGKAKYKVEEPSNTIIVAVRPAPVVLTIVSKPPTIKAGESAEIEVMVERQAWEGKPLQLHGYVIAGSIRRRPGSLDYTFKVQNNPPRSSEPGPVVEVSYTGIVPDTFKAGADVVLRGRLAADGFHTAPDGVVAKCPSKYEPTLKPSVSRDPRFAG